VGLAPICHLFLLQRPSWCFGVRRSEVCQCRQRGYRVTGGPLGSGRSGAQWEVTPVALVPNLSVQGVTEGSRVRVPLPLP
jgi:hypothetical protein